MQETDADRYLGRMKTALERQADVTDDRHTLTGYLDITDERGMPERIRIEELYQIFRQHILADLAAPSQWRDISTYEGCSPVIVTRVDCKFLFHSYAAFLDVTGVWRIFGSAGGNELLRFTPTH